MVWAITNWVDIEGRARRENVDMDVVLTEPAYVLHGLLFSFAVDDLVGMERPRLLARRMLRWMLTNGRMPTDDELAGKPPEDEPPNPDTWGLLPEHQEGQARAFALAGGDDYDGDYE